MNKSWMLLNLMRENYDFTFMISSVDFMLVSEVAELLRRLEVFKPFDPNSMHGMGKEDNLSWLLFW